MKQEDIDKIVAALSGMSAPSAPDALSSAENHKEMKRFAEMSHVILAEFPELPPEDRSIVLGLAFIQSISAWTKAGCEDLFTIEDPHFKGMLRKEFASCVMESVKSKSQILTVIWRAMFMMGDFQ